MTSKRRYQVLAFTVVLLASGLTIFHLRCIGQIELVNSIHRAGGECGFRSKKTNWGMIPYGYGGVVDSVSFWRVSEAIVFHDGQNRNNVDEILPSVAKLRDVQLVNLTNCEVSGAALLQLSSLPRMHDLRLSGVTVSAEELAAVSKFRSLKSLDLFAARFSESDLSEISSSSSLTSLSLSCTSVTDSGLSYIKNLSHLRELDLCNAKVSDVGIRDLSQLGDLKTLNLCGTFVTDSCVSDLSRMKSLKYVNITNTEISKTAADKLEAAIPGIEIEQGDLMISWQ